jgi:hypothetical protein
MSSLTIEPIATKSSRENWCRIWSCIYTLIRSETIAMARAKVVAIKTIPLWSVAVMTAKGGAWPGRREEEFESIVIEVLKVFNVQVETKY